MAFVPFTIRTPPLKRLPPIPPIFKDDTSAGPTPSVSGPYDPFDYKPTYDDLKMYHKYFSWNHMAHPAPVKVLGNYPLKNVEELLGSFLVLREDCYREGVVVEFCNPEDPNFGRRGVFNSVCPEYASQCVISLDGDGIVFASICNIRSSIPRVGEVVTILKGFYENCKGKLLKKNDGEKIAIVEIVAGPSMLVGRILSLGYGYIGYRVAESRI